MKTIINKLNLNCKQFSELYEIPYMTVNQWYNGKRIPPKWVVKLFNELIESKKKGEQIEMFDDKNKNQKQPKYVYCFIDETKEIPLRLRRFTNCENFFDKDKERDGDNDFWIKRYKEKAKTCDIYRYTLSNEIKITP